VKTPVKAATTQDPSAQVATRMTASQVNQP
jgi:hypothetical protein